MAMQNQNAEPSMEEILASIRRIISEDDDGGRRKEEPLELSQPAPKAEAAPVTAADDLMVFDEEPAAPEPAPAPPPPRVEPAPPPRPVARAPQPAPEPEFDAPLDQIVGEPALAAAAGAFTKLAGTLRVANAPGQTLEGIVRELLRPMMKEWLDAHLPAIVESMVEAELERISRLSR
jgi:hypothetical protein